MKLVNKTKNLVITDKLLVADSYKKRSIGLMGKKYLEKKEALYIPNCKSIHTHFMRFSLDVIFVSKEGEVKKILWNYSPWRISLPVWSAKDVIEFSHGDIEPNAVSLGDILHVEA